MKIGEKDYGPQPFFCPIRSRLDHMPFPGLKVGDIGTKMGYNSVDNGYIAFDHYRVPRTCLLSKFVSVNREGDFELMGDPRTIYQIMVITRLMIIFGASYAIFRSSTIATRYAVCRRQFANQSGTKEERKLIDYQTHMHILGPHIANAYVIYLTGRTLENLYLDSKALVEKGSFKLLDILHHFTAGMKSLSTDMSYKGTDELRVACGGAGYLNASGVSGHFTEYSVLATYEGVNVLMTQ